MKSIIKSLWLNKLYVGLIGTQVISLHFFKRLWFLTYKPSTRLWQYASSVRFFILSFFVAHISTELEHASPGLWLDIYSPASDALSLFKHTCRSRPLDPLHPGICQTCSSVVLKDLKGRYFCKEGRESYLRSVRGNVRTVKHSTFSGSESFTATSIRAGGTGEAETGEHSWKVRNWWTHEQCRDFTGGENLIIVPD